MIARNRERPDDEMDGLVQALEAIARRLDTERYPGRAWPFPVLRSARRTTGTRAAWLAAAAVAAGLAAVLVYRLPGPQPPTGTEIAGADQKEDGTGTEARSETDPRWGSPGSNPPYAQFSGGRPGRHAPGGRCRGSRIPTRLST